jgi:hypothetical protein
MVGSTSTISTLESSTPIAFDNNMLTYLEGKRNRLDAAAGFRHKGEITTLAFFLTLFVGLVTRWAVSVRHR